MALLTDEAVRSAVGLALGCDLEYHARIDSTQDRARALAAEFANGAKVPRIVVAEEQTAGRGTRDRVWIAAAGTSLLASWIFLPGPVRHHDGDLAEPAAHPTLFAVASLLAGVAVVRALAALEISGASLKWPNDVVFRGRKVAGVLAHATSGRLPVLVIGIGINVQQDRSGFPEAVRDTATSLALEGGAPDRLELLAQLTRELSLVLGQDPAAALDEWRSRSTIIGRRVVVERPGEPALSGVALELAPDGALVIETAYGPERILAGEVTVSDDQ